MSLMQNRNFSFNLASGSFAVFAMTPRPRGEREQVIWALSNGNGAPPKLKLFIDVSDNLIFSADDVNGVRFQTDGLPPTAYTDRFIVLFTEFRREENDHYRLAIYIDNEQVRSKPVDGTFDLQVTGGAYTVGADIDGTKSARFSLYEMALFNEVSEADRRRLWVQLNNKYTTVRRSLS